MQTISPSIKSSSCSPLLRRISLSSLLHQLKPHQSNQITPSFFLPNKTKWVSSTSVRAPLECAPLDISPLKLPRRPLDLRRGPHRCSYSPRPDPPSSDSHTAAVRPLLTKPLLSPGDAQDARDQVYNGEPHESKISHELLGAGAAFEAMHVFEKRQRDEGKPVSHGMAKELLAAAAGFEVDKLVETRGLDFIDREKAKHHAKQQAEQMYDSQYGDMNQYDP